MCERCGGSGFLAGGLEVCECRVAAERAALARAAGLPVGGGVPLPLPPAVAAWFDSYRPEDGWPWLLVAGLPGDATPSVMGALARLVAAIGVPVERVEADAPHAEEGGRGRIVVCVGVERLGPARAARLVARASAEGRTIVATTALDPEGPLEAAVGLEAWSALWASGEVVRWC